MGEQSMTTIESATLDQGRAGDRIVWVRVSEMGGVIFVDRREGIAHHRDRLTGDWLTVAGVRITEGHGEGITITVHRPVCEMPTERLTAIVASDACERIEAQMDGRTWYAREAVLGWDGRWHAVWRSDELVWPSMLAKYITEGTWKVDKK